MTNLLKNYSISPNNGKTADELNTALDTLYADWAMLYDVVTTIDDRINKSERRLTGALAGIETTLSALNSATPTVADYFAVSVYDLRHIETSLIHASSTAQVWTEYGIATPSIVLQSDNQFCVKDAIGNLWVPSSVSLRYATLAEGDTPPIEADYTSITTGEELLHVFDDQTSHSVEITLSSGATDVWVEALLPRDYLFQQMTNGLFVKADPAFGALLIMVEISVAGVWQTVEEYASGEYATPHAFFIAPTKVEKVRLHYRVTEDIDGEYLFYLTHIGAHYIEWNSSDTLVLDLTPYLADESVFIYKLIDDNIELIPTVEPGDSELQYELVSLDESNPDIDNGIAVTLSTLSSGRPEKLSALVLNTLEVE